MSLTPLRRATTERVPVITYDQALALLLSERAVLAVESVALTQAAGRVLADEMASPIDLPSFDHAAMDGFALAAGAGLSPGSEHEVTGTIAAGDEAGDHGGGAHEIMTGAPLPRGLDAVIAVERIELVARGGASNIRLLDSLAAGQNVRRAGSDVALGDTVLSRGTVLGPAQIMLLAALGVTAVPVMRRPRVAVISTGKELQEPGTPLREGAIYPSNRAYLASALASAGADVMACHAVGDDAAAFRDVIGQVLSGGVDLIVTTGAVSMGRYDFIPQALEGLGAQLLFHKVAVRPGKPLLAAVLGEGPLLLAMPGTPMAVSMAMRFFLDPWLRTAFGQAPELPWHARLRGSVSSKVGLRHFLRARLQVDAHGQCHVDVSAPQEPFRIHPFAHANAWVVLPEDTEHHVAGSVVPVYPLHAGEPLTMTRQPVDEGRS